MRGEIKHSRIEILHSAQYDGVIVPSPRGRARERGEIKHKRFEILRSAQYDVVIVPSPRGEG